MFKNLSIKQISFISSVAVLSLVIVINGIFRSLVFRDIVKDGWLVTLVFLLVGGICCYFILGYFLDIFIYRKIKLIYKIIRKSKVSTEAKKITTGDDDILNNVEDEVVKWAEDQQKEIDSLRALENYRRDYVGNISHELKTPIFNIQGYIHTLLDGGLKDVTINEKYLKRASKNVERLQNIVQDLDLISRLESQASILDITSFDIKQMVGEVFEHLEMQAEQKKIRLHFKDGADRTFDVNADRENIRQVLINLVLNAIKYGRDEGYVKVSFYDMDTHILIEISDDGLGIPENHLKHLFDRFYRVEKSRSREAGGTGLGLAIVKHILEAHKQTINVRSTENVGSTFGFTLSKA